MQGPFVSPRPDGVTWQVHLDLPRDASSEQRTLAWQLVREKASRELWQRMQLVSQPCVVYFEEFSRPEIYGQGPPEWWIERIWVRLRIEPVQWQPVVLASYQEGAWSVYDVPWPKVLARQVQRRWRRWLKRLARRS